MEKYDIAKFFIGKLKEFINIKQKEEHNMEEDDLLDDAFNDVCYTISINTMRIMDIPYIEYADGTNSYDLNLEKIGIGLREGKSVDAIYEHLDTLKEVLNQSIKEKDHSVFEGLGLNIGKVIDSKLNW